MLKNLALLFVSVLLVPTNGFCAESDSPLTFERDIRPIFREYCFDCHGAVEEMKGKLDLRLVRSMQKGGESGPAIVTGKPGESYLIERVRSGEMPPGEKHLPDDNIATIERWITAGAKTARPEPESIGPGLGITLEERSFWSFQPIKRHDVPKLPKEARARTPIDAFILAAMKGKDKQQAAFSPDADRFTIVRRAYFDLLGLPPSPDEMKKWMEADGDDWYERLIDELLDSQHYGERWARHWLDIVGYADSEGYTVSDAVRDWSWKYRDWVIRALNGDKPFDRFLTEQLAGDELAGKRDGDLTAEQIDLLTATGFLRMAADGTGSGVNNPASRNQVMTDTLKIIGTSLLGLSVHCAQCHDHRYDPIPQTDYYALRAVFEPALDWKSWKVPSGRRVSLYTAADRKKAAEIEGEANKIGKEKQEKQEKFISDELEKQLKRVKDESLREPLRKAYRTPGNKRDEKQKKLLATYPFVRQLSPGQLYLYNKKAADELKAYDKKIADKRGEKPAEEFLRALIESDNHAPETKLFFRGDHQQPKQTVAPAALTVAAAEGERVTFEPNDSKLPTTGRRSAFAKWLTSGKHPLVARVIVNRVWMHHFGRGLVGTPTDFGKLGTKPTHPKLLDWLADEFVQQGWSLKKLHRLIMTSTVWRQSSEITADNDGPNDDYRRKPLVRLEAESIRDRMLAASGELSRDLFGKPAAIKEDDTGQVVVSGDQKRRSLYIQMRRSRPVAMMQAFDAPVMETNCECRPTSTVATQSLMLLNGGFILAQSAKLAIRVEKEAKPLSPGELSSLPKLPIPSISNWRFGYGQFDEKTKKVGKFTKLPHWTGSAWQGGPKLPDPKISWAFLTATGGHPGRPHESPIRRWIAPADGTISIVGSLKHSSPNGNGVRGRIVSSRSGLSGEWKAHNKAIDTKVDKIEVKKDDFIDFVTDCIDSHTSDSFNWTATITLNSPGQEPKKFDSAKGFRGPLPAEGSLAGQVVRAWELTLSRTPTPDELQIAVDFLVDQLAFLQANPSNVPTGLTARRQAMTSLCQALMSSNEFLYVD